MGRKEDNIKRAETLLHKKEFIRNIGTAAHIDHGKCVSGDTRLWVNGEWVRADDLWSMASSDPEVSNALSAEIRDVMGCSLWTRSIEIKTGDVSFAQITHAWRLKATEPLVEVETRDGRRVRTTREHRFVAASGHQLEFREARELHVGDMLAVPRHLPSRNDSEGWEDLEAQILTRLAGDPRFIFELTPAGARIIGVSGELRGSRLMEAARAAGLSANRTYGLIRRVTYRFSDSTKRASPMYLPRREALERSFR